MIVVAGEHVNPCCVRGLVSAHAARAHCSTGRLPRGLRTQWTPCTCAEEEQGRRGERTEGGVQEADISCHEARVRVDAAHGARHHEAADDGEAGEAQQLPARARKEAARLCNHIYAEQTRAGAERSAQPWQGAHKQPQDQNVQDHHGRPNGSRASLN